MKRLALLLTAGLVLTACGDEEASEPVNVEGTVEDMATEEEPSQEELNAQMKEEAQEVSFVQVNADEIEPGTKVKVTGEVSNLVDDVLLEFTLTTQENDGVGMYQITGVNTEDTEIADGQTVTVYGTYDGKSDAGLPQINMTIAE